MAVQWELPKLRVDVNGDWFDDDVEVTHPGILLNLRGNLRRDAQGYFIQTRVRIPVEVADVPFVVIRFERRAGGVAWWLTAGAQPATVDEIGDQVQTLPRGRLPVFGATEEVARLYRFAVENPDTLAWMPCTCGCASLGHTSNRACYIKAESEGRITFTSHAAT